MILDQTIAELYPTIFKTIKNAFKHDRLPHAFLLVSEQSHASDQVGMFIAEYLMASEHKVKEATLALAHNPDFLVLEASVETLKKEAIIAALTQLKQTALSSNQVKVCWIKKLEHASKHALNALLKFLEAPAPNTYLIMSTQQLAKVLKTIISRATLLQIPHVVGNQEVSLTKPKTSEALLLNKTYAFLALAIEDQRQIFNALYELLDAQNVNSVLGFLATFCQTVTRVKHGLITSHKQWALLQAYVHFNVVQALSAINTFKEQLAQHVNFKVALPAFILDFMTAYE